MFSGAVSALQEAELANIDAKYDAEIQRAGDNSEEVARLEKEKENKKLAVQKKYANVQFAIKVSEIIANTAVGIMQAFAQITFNCLFLYISVTPIIAFTSRVSDGHMIGVIIAFVYGYGGMFASGNMLLANIYPITASMGLIQYRSYDTAVHWNIGLCGLSMLAVLLVSVVIVITTKNVSSVKAVKKQKNVTKKGW